MLEYVQRNSERSPERGLRLYERFDDDPGHVGYRAFPEHVAAAAEQLRDQGVRPGARVLFPFETSFETVFAFLGLIEIGAVPLSVKPFLMATARNGYQDFLGRIVKDFGVSHLLRTPSLATISVDVDSLTLPAADERKPGARLRTPTDDELAFVQFSSGSTSFPKGVPIRHGKLRGNLDMILRTDGRTSEERVSIWLPLYHDMGLVGGLLSCLAIGGDLLLTEPMTFLTDAAGWWRHMAAEHVAGTAIPNFAVDYSLKLLAVLPPEELAELDLSAVRTVYLGSEPINIPNLTAFLDLMAPAGLRPDVFMPCYGMAEAVLVVSSRPHASLLRTTSSPSGVPAISVGAPMPEFTVRLRDDEGRVCAEGELGEIELSGGTLAEAYFEDPRPLTGSDGFYATGDIGFMESGELFVTGRISDRIKVNGQSLFAADFEQAVERLSFVREGRTVVLQSAGRIVLLAEVDRPAREDVEGARTRIVDHLVHTVGVTVRSADVHFVQPGQLSRTSSGKLQRRAIAKAYEEGRIKGLTLR